eukprot:CAMPEP_0184680488 /NCGR_PEP_ID=MMETSP0312-20130426/3366_1 /TAXON_ID=31354 /ORGANISM="Compsopogon coeruleus, Strain SAG 36.94" /LENGTH=100 /DNA_ID=CAMNT_0027130623 /DNA_START=664 /DNA_END=966 /DNA_ORIENTATION=+
MDDLAAFPGPDIRTTTTATNGYHRRTGAAPKLLKENDGVIAKFIHVQRRHSVSDEEIWAENFTSPHVIQDFTKNLIGFIGKYDRFKTEDCLRPSSFPPLN